MFWINLHEEHLSQLLQANNNYIKRAVTFLTNYNGTLKNRSAKNKINFEKSYPDEDGFIQIAIQPQAYELESLYIENKRIINGECYFADVEYPFRIKSTFSTLGIVAEISRQKPKTSFTPDNSTRHSFMV